MKNLYALRDEDDEVLYRLDVFSKMDFGAVNLLSELYFSEPISNLFKYFEYLGYGVSRGLMDNDYEARFFLIAPAMDKIFIEQREMNNSYCENLKNSLNAKGRGNIKFQHKLFGGEIKHQLFYDLIVEVYDFFDEFIENNPNNITHTILTGPFKDIFSVNDKIIV
ncbi:MAG: hypothetical protein KAS12_03040 [Candidatus Aenigmarchaeota archaeon]|nr:hypothetical protein [Candidatus Aenigmarchaeota archaeon]